jgi:hypothetical protein
MSKAAMQTFSVNGGDFSQCTKAGVRLESGFVAQWFGQGCSLKCHWEPLQMTIHAHIAELERKHRALDDEIAEAMAHPSTDDIKIAELKRRKLLVKDEIQRMRIGEPVSLH